MDLLSTSDRFQEHPRPVARKIGVWQFRLVRGLRPGVREGSTIQWRLPTDVRRVLRRKVFATLPACPHYAVSPKPNATCWQPLGGTTGTCAWADPAA
jgi:hypothetical protein